MNQAAPEMSRVHVCQLHTKATHPPAYRHLLCSNNLPCQPSAHTPILINLFPHFLPSLYSSVFPAACSSVCWLMSEWWVMALLPICLRLLCFSWAVLERMREMAFSEWEWLILSGNTQWNTLQYSLCLQITGSVAFKLVCYQKYNSATKVEKVMGFCDPSFSDVLKVAEVLVCLLRLFCR